MLAFVALAVLAPNAPAASVPVQGDAWTTDRHPTRNYGADRVMRVSSRPVKRAYLRFETGALTGPVQKAVLRVYSQTTAPEGFSVFAVSPDWAESTITHANAPAPGALVGTVPGYAATGTWREIDVTSAVAGAGAWAFAVTTPTASRNIDLGTKEGGRPAELVVTTADPDPEPDPGTTITTDRSWECRGALAAFGALPIKVVSAIPNPGTADAVRLIGCYGDGNPGTVDLILDVRGNGADLGTGYDAVKIGQNAHDLVVTGSVACGARTGVVHQDVVQAMSGWNIEFRDFTAGDPRAGAWTCWGAGGGWYVSHVPANGQIPTDLVCVRCRIATYNQNLRIDESIRSGARDSVFGYSRSYGIFVGPGAVEPVNENNEVIRY